MLLFLSLGQSPPDARIPMAAPHLLAPTSLHAIAPTLSQISDPALSCINIPYAAASIQHVSENATSNTRIVPIHPIADLTTTPKARLSKRRTHPQRLISIPPLLSIESECIFFG